VQRSEPVSPGWAMTREEIGRTRCTHYKQKRRSKETRPAEAPASASAKPDALIQCSTVVANVPQGQGGIHMKLLKRSAVAGLVYSVLAFTILAAPDPATAEPSHGVSRYSPSQVNSPERVIGNSASAGACVYESSGQVKCEGVYFVESFTAKVAYEFTELSLSFFESGPESNGNGYMHCYVPKDSLKVTKVKGATVNAVLDTESSLCDSNYGVMCDGNYENCIDSPYSGVITVSGGWSNPSSEDTTITTIKHRDLVTGDSSFSDCNNYFGNGVRNGSFSIAGRTFVIGNLDVSGSFTLSTCIQTRQ